MNHPGILPEFGRPKHLNASILRLPDLVLRHVFLYLEAPAVIRKIPHDHLHEVFEGRDISESDPRDLYNLLRACRTLYETYEDIVKGKQLFNRFYLNILRPPHQEPQLIQQEGTGKLQLFVVNPKWQFARESVVQRAFQDPSIVHPKGSTHPQEPSENKDVLIDMLSRQCLKWIGTFSHWPSDSPLQANDDPTVALMANLRQNILGIINFHQYVNSVRPKYNTGESIFGVSGYGTRRFWAIICHCKGNNFLVIYNARGTIWDHNFTCPRIAIVTNTYADARRTYEQALASGYYEVETGR